MRVISTKTPSSRGGLLAGEGAYDSFLSNCSRVKRLLVFKENKFDSDPTYIIIETRFPFAKFFKLLICIAILVLSLRKQRDMEGF